MDAFRTRINEDVNKLENLARVTHGRVRILRLSGDPVNRIEIELKYSTLPSKNYLAERQNSTVATIELSARYPFSQPRVVFNPAIFHPNVYSSGLVDLGRWLPTEFLDSLIRRLVQILTFDPTVISVSCPSNGEAANWYSCMLHMDPTLVPTERLDAVFPPSPELPKHNIRDNK